MQYNLSAAQKAARGGIYVFSQNRRSYQKELFLLEKEDQLTLLNTLKRCSRLTWEQIYKDHRLRWEAISTKRGPNGESLYRFRISKKFRALAFRQKEWICLISIHPDHDSAYK